jgi:hypothetical protein
MTIVGMLMTNVTKMTIVWSSIEHRARTEHALESGLRRQCARDGAKVLGAG